MTKDLWHVPEEQYVGRCNSCAAVFNYTANLTKCPEFGKIVILKYIEDKYF